MSVMVIAEPGSTAEGRVGDFLSLISAAAAAGCSVFKNQYVSDPDQLCDRRNAPTYRDAYAKIAYDLSYHRALAAAARAHGMLYACSVYLPGDVARVEPFCDYLKCASFESGDQAMYRALWPFRHRTFVSFGMGGDPLHYQEFAARLHCISAYPAPEEQMNLARIGPHLNGLSDHSKNPWTGALAVAAGAKFIEFHLRLDTADPANADYAVARTPEQARVYVENIRLAERMLGDGRRRIQPAEEEMAKYRAQPYGFAAGEWI